MSIAIVRAFGTISHNKPNFFASKIDVAVIKPVTLPSGRLKLETRPDFTGSLLAMMRIGMVEVADFAACALISPPPASSTRTRRCTRSLAALEMVVCAPRPPILDHHTLVLDKPCVVQALPKSTDDVLERFGR